MITIYSETLRLKLLALELVESDVISMDKKKLEELKGEILLLKRLESEEVKDAIRDLLGTDKSGKSYYL